MNLPLIVLALPAVAAVVGLALRQRWLGIVGSTALLAATLALLVEPGSATTTLGGLLHVDALSTIGLLLNAVVAVVISWFPARRSGKDHDKDHSDPTAFAMIAAANGACLAPDLAWLLAAVFLTALLGIVHTASPRRPRCLAAAFGLAIPAIAGLGIGSLGILYLDPFAGWTTPAAVAGSADLGLVLTSLGIAALCGLAPLSATLADAHATGDGRSRTLLSGILVNVGAYAMLRLFATSAAPAKSVLFLTLGCGSVLLATLGMARSGSVSRLLAHSSAQHVGLVLFALATGPAGATAALLLWIGHGVAKTQTFLAADLAQGEAGGSGPCGFGAGAFVVGSLLIAGMPPSGTFRGIALALSGGAILAPVATLAIALSILAGGFILVTTAVGALTPADAASDRPGPTRAWPRAATTTVVLLTVLGAGMGLGLPPSVAALVADAAAILDPTATTTAAALVVGGLR